MKRVFVYISYHPGALTDLVAVRKAGDSSAGHIIVFCSHPYLGYESIKTYVHCFDHAVFLPDIDYQTNLLLGVWKQRRFLGTLHRALLPLLSDAGRIDIVSDCSAYLPVNSVLSYLKSVWKASCLVSTRENYRLEKDVDRLRTLRAGCYVRLLKLKEVYAHSLLSYKYSDEPADIIVRVLGPFEAMPEAPQQESVPRFFIRRPVSRRAEGNRDVIIFYGDRQFQSFPCQLTLAELRQKLREMFVALARHYRGCRIVYKPHPQDQGKTMEEAAGIECQIYSGTLSSQAHLDSLIDRVRACYSVSSTSLLYAAGCGVPAYTFHRYAGFNGEFPVSFFENEAVRKNPFLFNICRLEDIGSIDGLRADPVPDDQSVWMREALSR